MKTEVKRDPFETGGEPEEVTVTIRGESRKYLLNDINFERASAMFRAKYDDDGKKIEDPEHAAKLIAAVVTREDGSEITVEEAKAFRFQVSNVLSVKVVEFLNGPVNEGKESATTS